VARWWGLLGLGRRGCGVAVGAGEDRADGPVRDLGGSGDVALGESEPGGVGDRLVEVVFGFAPAAGGPLDAGEQLA